MKRYNNVSFPSSVNRSVSFIFSLEPGTDRQERRGRLRERSDMGQRLRTRLAVRPLGRREATNLRALHTSDPLLEMVEVGRVAP